VTPPGNDITRPQDEWHQEQSFDTLEQCVTIAKNRPAL
jgi:hypothetical protein